MPVSAAVSGLPHGWTAEVAVTLRRTGESEASSTDEGSGSGGHGSIAGKAIAGTVIGAGVIAVVAGTYVSWTADQGVTGRAYIFAYTTLTLKPLVHLVEEIGRELAGLPIVPFDLMAAMDAKLRLLSWQ